MKLPRWILEFSGHTMLHKYFPFVIYRPDIHRVKGHHSRLVLNTVCEGDILLRRFDGYLNTIFTPGFWGHAGIYVGFNQVVHAIGTGAEAEDILDFCRCDAICVLEPLGCNKEAAIDCTLDMANKNIPYDFDFSSENETYYCTELVDKAYNGIFYNDYQVVAGKMILTPDGIWHSKRVRLKLEIKP